VRHLPQSSKSIGLRRAERELFFWTAREILKLVILATLTACAVVSLAAGKMPYVEAMLRHLLV
jgi:hypothetical protein